MFKVRMLESEYTKPWKLKIWNLCLQPLWLWQVLCLHPLCLQKNKILVNEKKPRDFAIAKSQYNFVALCLKGIIAGQTYLHDPLNTVQKNLICRYRLQINSKCWQMASETLQVLLWENGKRRKYIAKASLPTTFILLPLVRV